MPTSNSIMPFTTTLAKHGLHLPRMKALVLQVNMGKFCNQACHHCHVEASPKRTEMMESGTVDRILELLKKSGTIKTVDVTGGAPELNPHFRRLVREVGSLGIDLMDRCNLTVLFEKGQEGTPHFLSSQRVKIVASLPCYSKSNVERQRGKGVFDKSIEALRCLNRLGYGQPSSGLILDLVYNPGGPFLPPLQSTLEAQYKTKLFEDLGIVFNRLYTITNMPIKRFLWDLERQGKLDEYMTLLVQNFNAHAARGVMCRDLISVSWDGKLYDCDFNQMLEIPISRTGATLWGIDSFSDFDGHGIAFDDHCYGCTAGAGSSCGGSIA